MELREQAIQFISENPMLANEIADVLRARAIVGLTERQTQMFDFIQNSVKDRGLFPTYEEMAHHLGFSSRARAHAMANRMVKKGILTRVHKGARGMRIEV